MPIAICFLNKSVERDIMNQIAREWSDNIGVDSKDICINYIQNFYQAGQQYEALVNLYLPSLWTDSDIKKIQNELLNVLVKHLHITHNLVFIITSIIESGHVVENGNIITW
jgi:hypothetical protein